MAKAYEERVIGPPDVTPWCKRMGELLSMLRVDVVVPVITDAYYAWICLDPSSIATSEPEDEKSWSEYAGSLVSSAADAMTGEEEVRNKLSTSPLLYKMSAQEPQEGRGNAEKDLTVEAGRIRLGFYDASWEGDITRKHRETMQGKEVRLVSVQNFRQRLTEAEETEVEVELHPFGLANRYERASDWYDPGGLR